MEGARPATDADVSVITALAREAFREKDDVRGGRLWQLDVGRREPIEESLAEAAAASDQLLLAGTIDDVVVGYAAVRVRPLSSGELLGEITDLFTLEGARGVGVGEAMMGEVLQWCEDQRCIGVDSVALPGDRATKNFFETFGLTARAITVHRSLS